MTKTILLDESVHKYLKKVQSILYHEYNIEMRLQDIMAYIVNDKIVGDARKLAKRVFEDTTKNNDIAGANEANEDITVVPMGD